MSTCLCFLLPLLDVRDILPVCAAISRAGETIWAQKECLAHHYKFVLALENSQDRDYVTEKLFQVRAI